MMGNDSKEEHCEMHVIDHKNAESERICGGEAPSKVKPAKKKRRNKSDLGEHFVAPDGGWGWLVAIACGVATLVTFSTAQQFGIIFRGHLADLGISSYQLTTIINTQSALSSMIGLFNGPLFRRFSYRQVGLMGSLLVFTGVFSCAFANSFSFFIFSYACCYGFGRGFIVSASAVAFNTYFKKKRRIAASYQYGVSGLGPILLPYFATFLVSSVGVRYTVVCFAGLSLNTIACSLVYQPVKWHVKNPDKDAEASKKLTTSEDKETIDSESLNKVSFRNRVGSRKKTDRVPSSSIDMAENSELKSLKDNSDGPNVYPDKSLELKMEETRHSVQNEGNSMEQNLKAKIDKKDDDRPMKSWLANIVAFFDLDLLRDISYMNLVIGLTLINFVEINFAILTPFILSDFGFQNQQIALAMTLLGVCDLVVRFLVPLITSKIHLSNKVFFAFGLLGMSVGRLFLSFTSDFYTLIGVFLWLGLSKGFRTVFWGLIIPGYVPLKKLPAAVGIQRLISGLFSLACGPLIGLIRDKTSYAVVLNFLNVLCLVALSMWLLEFLVRKYCSNKSVPINAESK